MSFTVSPEQAASPFVLALDVSSTGARGGRHGATALPLQDCRLRIGHAFSAGSDGTPVTDRPRRDVAQRAGREACCRDRVTAFRVPCDKVVAR